MFQSFMPNNEYEKTSFKIIINDSNCKENLISYYYWELFNSISIILNDMYEVEKDNEKQIQIKNYIAQIFGEDIVKLFSNN